MHQYKGKLIIHTGSMFSGKTSSLKRDLNRFKIAGYRTKIFKPKVDTREVGKITIHGEDSITATTINSIDELIKDVEENNLNVVGIDEVQFLSDDIDTIKEGMYSLLRKGVTVVMAGLDMDYNGIPFEVVKEFLPLADYLHKHHAVCTLCGTDAWVSHRKIKSEGRVLIGAEGEYEPLCRSCYEKVREEEEQEVNKNQLRMVIEK